MNGASGALIRNSVGEILIVKPTYREDWLLPGGVIEAGELPMEACKRECKEELSVDVYVSKLLCFEYRKATEGQAETTRFIFACGTALEEIRLQEGELSDYRLTSLKNAMSLVDTLTARRLQRIQEGKPVYFES